MADRSISKRKKLAFAALAAILTASIGFGILFFAVSVAKEGLRPLFVDLLFLSMTEEERQELRNEIAANVGSLWDAVPEPLVARLGKRNLETVQDQAVVKLNNAGLRSSRRYMRKKEGVFRIVCLGDSMVFGHGGKEADRFCDQMEQFYRHARITAEGKRIELYAVGIDSWTAIQEATYLSSRISDYDPDVIVVMTTANDISDAAGVSGSGTASHAFSPQQRAMGSGAFWNIAGMPFGSMSPSILSDDLVPQARLRWSSAMAALKRLTELQRRRGKKILHSVLVIYGEHFTELYKLYFSEAQIDAPFIVTRYFKDDTTKLPHDGHPNRLGHSIFAAHFIHALDRLGWVPVPDEALPELHAGLSLEFGPTPDPAVLRRHRSELADEILRTSLEFDSLTSVEARALLGGVFPDWNRRIQPLPWGSLQSGFALRRPEGPVEGVEVVIEIPPLVELFPFHLDLYVNGELMKQYDFPEPWETEVYTLVAAAPPLADDDLAVEVLLRTDSYFTTIFDARMKSFRLVSARVR